MSDSESDSFIREVSEEVRQDRMLQYWKRYGPAIIGGIAAVVVAAAGWSWWQAAELEAARDRGGALLAASASADGGAASDLTALSEIDGPAATVARLTEAAALARSGDVEAAALAYEAAAEGAPSYYADLALLQAVRLRAETGSASEQIAVLDQLAADGRPYRVLALELRAMIRLAAGETAAARADIEAALEDPTATVETRARLREVLVVMGDTEPDG